MREILFRGKSTYGDEWLEGDLIHYDTNEYLILEQGFRLCDIQHDGVPIRKETIGQYTGVKDKHGVKIFEGDIIRTISIIASDKVGDNAFNVVVKWSGSGWIANGSLSCMHSSIYEVVGNIYDNKDLIK